MPEEFLKAYLGATEQIRAEALAVAFAVLQGKNPAKVATLNTPITRLNFPEKAMRQLRKNDFQTIADLLTIGPKGLLRYRGIGPSRMKEIKDTLREFGVEFGNDTNSDTTPKAQKEKNK